MMVYFTFRMINNPDMEQMLLTRYTIQHPTTVESSPHPFVCFPFCKTKLNKEKSYLNHWYIEDDTVYYDCHLVFSSDGREDVSFQICAFSEKDFQANLISTALLNCDSVLHIPAGTTEYGVDVLLYAPRGHANTKPDRLLPETIIPHSISISKTD